MLSDFCAYMNRRRFIRASAATSLGIVLSRTSFTNAFAKTPKKFLVFGGTDFLGPAVVDALMVDGHTVTIFNRGVTNAELFPRVEKLKGFRSADPNDQDPSALAHRRFDAVIDVWPNDPEILASAAEFLKDRTNHYLFVSSVGAYDHKLFAKPDLITEDAPTQPWNEPGRQYNRNKAESERRLHKIIGERLTVARPGPIMGHRDGGGDLLTWLLRSTDGGDHIVWTCPAQTLSRVDRAVPLLDVKINAPSRRLASIARRSGRSTYSPMLRRKLAFEYSRFNFAMKLALISAGQTASHSYVLVRFPKPSASITCTIFRTRATRSGFPWGNSDRCETFAAVKSMADPFGQAAAHAPQPIQAAASIARSASCLGIGIEFASGAEPARAEMKPPAWTIRSSALRSTTKSLITGKLFTRNGSITMVAPSRNFLMYSSQAAP